jgi:site-specific DNA-methyltransferase (adenine-specific)
MNRLFYGDNLEVMREHIPAESVDLVYLDPPFNSSRAYNVIFGRNPHAGNGATAQIQAFDDTWQWTPVTDQQYQRWIGGGELPMPVADALMAFRTLLGENDAMAYLVNMAPRLVELRRLMKRTGVLYLHCDPTMSHYLKVMLDAIFSAENFRNEIIWQRTGAKGLMTRRLPTNHDVILSYQRGAGSTWVGSAAFIPYDKSNLSAKTAAKYSNIDKDGRHYELKDITNPNADRPNLTYEFLGVTRVWRWTKDRMQAAHDAGLIVQTAPGRVPRVKRYLDDLRGTPLSDVWSDIAPLNSQAAERLGYPTQKPLELLDRNHLHQQQPRRCGAGPVLRVRHHDRRCATARPPVDRH